MARVATGIVALVVLASAGCAPAAEPAPAAAPAGPSEAEDAAAIREVRLSQFAASFIASDADGFLASVAADMVIMPPDEPAVRGHTEIRAWLDAFFAAYTTDLHYTGSEVSVVGDTAFEAYAFRWTLTPLDGGEPIRQSGKGVYVFRRQADGGWKVARDIWNYTPTE